ncbi:receptor-type tyrosine-protein phosphatase H-like isoform X3 [Sparus aurata]|uniref:receptor-type tyrosine-protein phosphatase H-like isoform X3 n=1 Tax=Sparus aurata TaxID=8175 RepID=UPI0011C1AE60|nr:receptor-type tyrosine-protein phosphatase H-like isoform X3 [Sparus aurata]
MTKLLFFKVTSDQLLLCVFLSLLWGITDSTTAAGKTTVISSSSTSPATTSPTTTPPATKSPPENVKEVNVLGQSENNITLMWDKVNNISTYLLQYEGKGISKVENINSPDSEASVTHEVSSLTAGNKYNFTLFTVFEEVNSTGYMFQAVTAPRNTDVFEAIKQNETSITLQWNKVDEILNYILSSNGREMGVTASEGHEQVSHTVPGLTNGTKYDFILFTVFENVRSSGVMHTAATAPRNTDMFEAIKQNETSITLQWNKVDEILNYILSSNGREMDVTASEGHEQVSHTVPGLTNGTKYDFILFTVFENVRSSGVMHTAATAPRNTDMFEAIKQNETSITLQWNKVDEILNYILSSNGREMGVTASEGHEQVSHTVPGLTNGTKYDFILFTVFENVRSSGVMHTAATAPRNTDMFEAIKQNETSITLQWNKVDEILNYILSSNGREMDVTASEGHEQVSHTVPGLTNGTKYDFILFTVFENVRSSGVMHTAATAPRNTDVFEAIKQNETSITLQWIKVDEIFNYILLSSGREMDVTASEGHEQVSHTVPGLTNGTKYDFILFTVFENVRSSGVMHTAATVPSKVTSVSVTERSTTSITLVSKVDVDKDWSYLFQMNEESVPLLPNRATGVVSHRFTSLQPGRAYPFSVITQFFELNSTAYEDYTVTRIVCASVQWHVTNSSIQGMVEGLFTNATAKYESQEHVSPGSPNVSFTGLYPGATYELHLWYENNSKHLNQCEHSQTIIPLRLHARCENWDAGYSVRIVWDEPQSVWTAVEVNVMGKSHKKVNNGENYTILSGSLPAKHYEVSLTSLSGTGKGSEQRSEPYVFSCATDPRGVIAGSVFAVLLFVVLVCLIVFILLKRPDIIRRKKVHSKPPYKKTISVAKFPDHFYQLSGDDNRGFSQEYESLISVGTEQTRKEAVLPENKARNRFNNVLPYDWCRVKLTTSNPNSTSDYINASYMPGYNSNREYIATQGPLPSTVNDFWRMIWEQKVKGIVMVTNCTEGGRTKCEQYWPAKSDPCPYGELTVTMTSEQQEPNWTLREFRVKHSKTSEERTVKHFHFTAWPDHGVPQGTEVLIQFRGLVRQHIQREGAGAPTVVHCSAGVGRTGTIIALDVLLQQLEKERAVGINAFVHKMRLNRPHMVQTESQYIFLHQCIMDCLQPKEKMEENIYENAEMIYVNATALREFHKNA